MPDFLHGVELVELNDGARPIRTVKSSVIGVVGTAPKAEAGAFPYNTPVLLSGSRQLAAKLGSTGTLPLALDGIFDQAGAAVVVIRVESDKDAEQQQLKVIGGADDGGHLTGLNGLLSAQTVLGVEPRIVIAPGFSHELAVATEMLSIAKRLRGTAVIDAADAAYEDAVAYRKELNSDRGYLVYPWVKVLRSDGEVVEPASARVAGLIAQSDAERGFWWSPSNQGIQGIIGLSKSIDFKLGDVNCRANALNENNINTIVNQNGYRLWGNHTLGSDEKWRFINVRRTADIINDSLQRAHLWAVDQNITSNYVGSVTEGVNSYLRSLKQQGAILGGECWADEELNSASELSAGRVYFDFDFTPPAPAEHIQFRSQMVDSYFNEVV